MVIVVSASECAISKAFLVDFRRARSTLQWAGMPARHGSGVEPRSTGEHMSKLRFRISMSLDGFVAGPNQSRQEPLGVGGERLHDWVVALETWRRAHGKEGGDVNASTRVIDAAAPDRCGVYIAGGGGHSWRAV